MNEHVLAAIAGLDKSKTLGRVKPLHGTFSHHVVSAGLKTITIGRSLEPAYPTGARYAGWAKLDSLKQHPENPGKRCGLRPDRRFCLFRVILRGRMPQKRVSL
jgi:hypothetical protein